MGMMRLSVIVVVMALIAPLAGAAGRAPLIEAVKNGDLTAVRKLLETSAVNVAEPDGTTALHWAANRGDVAIVKALLAAGANPKAVTALGVTPLSLAAENGDPVLVEMLLKAGADPNSSLAGGETALMTAARTGTV